MVNSYVQQIVRPGTIKQKTDLTHKSLSAGYANDIFGSFISLVLTLRGTLSLSCIPLALLLSFGTLQTIAEILSTGGGRTD